jgi:pimeloyl-ACP methyl ester carboxylesterase
MGTPWARARRAAGIVWIGLAVLPALLAVLLLVVAETARGRLFGGVALLLLALPLLALAATTRGRRLALGIVGALALAGWLTLVMLAPDGQPLPGSRLRSEVLVGPRPSGLHLAWLLPEIDQLKLGTLLVWIVDPLLDRTEAGRLTELAMRHYRRVEADPELRALGSALPHAYADRDIGHLYAVVPAKQATGAVIFLHGSGGNFIAYLELLRDLSDRTGLVVVAPSYGFGHWEQPGGLLAIERARRHAVDRLGVDERRIFLMGLSNGGRGVTRAAAATPERWAGLVFYSAVMEDDILASPAFQAGWRGRRVLVVHGTSDDRLPRAHLDLALERMKAARVETLLVEGGDHFLLFDRPIETLDRVASFLTQ